MIDIENRDCKPTVDEMCALVGKPLFGELCAYMEREYRAVQSVEYSGDKVLLSWNLKFKKSRTLCTVYPRDGFFNLLLVVGRKEKERTELLLPTLSENFRAVYENTREGMGQRWMLFTFSERNAEFEDVLGIVKIRSESK